MDPITGSLIGSGVAALGGALGGSTHRTNPVYGREMNAAANRLKATGQQYGNLARTAQGMLTKYQPQYQRSLDSTVARLRTDPYNDDYRQMRLNQAMQGSAAAYQGARANLAADMARRGIAGSGTDTSGMAAIAAAQAAQRSQAQQQIAMDAVQERDRRQMQALGLLEGAQRNSYGQTMDAYGAQQGVDTNLFSLYNNLYRTDQMRTDGLNAQNAQGLGAFAGEFGSSLSSLLSQPKPAK